MYMLVTGTYGCSDWSGTVRSPVEGRVCGSAEGGNARKKGKKETGEK